MRNDLPRRPLKRECGILNRDGVSGRGTHWVCWYRNKNDKLHFDSFGVQPPNELIEYLSSPIFYNHNLPAMSQAMSHNLPAHEPWAKPRATMYKPWATMYKPWATMYKPWATIYQPWAMSHNLPAMSHEPSHEPWTEPQSTSHEPWTEPQSTSHELWAEPWATIYQPWAEPWATIYQPWARSLAMSREPSHEPQSTSHELWAEPHLRTTIYQPCATSRKQSRAEPWAKIYEPRAEP